MYSKLKQKIFSSERVTGGGYLLTNIIANGSVLLITLLVAGFYSKTDFGYFSLIFAYFSLLISIFTLGLDSAMLRFYFDDINHNKLLKVINTIWIKSNIILTFVAFFLSAILIYFNILKISYIDAILCIASASLNARVRIEQNYSVALRNVLLYGKIILINKLSLSILIGICILLNSKRFGLFILLSSIISFIPVFLNLKFSNKPDRVLNRNILKYSLPLTIGTISLFGSSYGYNILVSPFVKIEDIGVLNLFIQISSIYILITNSLAISYVPKFLTQAKLSLETACKNYYYYIALNSIVTIIPLFIFSLLIFTFLKNGEFSDYAYLIYIFLPLLFFFSFKAIPSGVLSFFKLSNKDLFLNIMSVVIGLIISYIFTKKYGISGAIISLALSFLIQIIFYSVFLINKFDVFKK